MLTHGFKRCIAMAVWLQCFWSFRDSKYHRRKYTRAKLFTSCCLESERGEKKKKKIEKGKEEWGRVARRVRVQEQPEMGEMEGVPQASIGKLCPPGSPHMTYFIHLDYIHYYFYHFLTLNSTVTTLIVQFTTEVSFSRRCHPWTLLTSLTKSLIQ